VGCFALQYKNWPQLPCNAECVTTVGNFGRTLQAKARREVGGTPAQAPGRYAERSAMTYASSIASSCTRLQLWWSHKDVIVMHAEHQEGRLFEALRKLGTAGRVDEFVGWWPHTRPMNAWTDLPRMLVGFGLLPERFDVKHENANHAALVGNGCGARR
jgi:hypothetical protein